MADLVQGVLTGDRRAIARMLTHVENEREGAEQALASLFPHTGRAWVIGITGAPGTGKSTLVTEIAKRYRAQNQQVGILAVDPTSPFTGGALLGDRIRMRDLSGDAGVFIRSMATRGSLGGLARATRDAIRVLDAGGFDVILVETVGAGQNEVDIVRAADTTIVVEAPGMGDEVQAIKAGILEIADVLVVNKADRQGVNHTVQALRMMLETGHPASRTQMHHGRLMPTHTAADSESPLWLPPIVQTVASEGKGIEEVIEAVAAHRRYLEGSALRAAVERQQIEVELYERLRDSLMARLLADVPTPTIAAVVERIQAREIDPQSAVRQLLAFTSAQVE
jgi:LAO/AO transport system kinase